MIFKNYLVSLLVILAILVILYCIYQIIYNKKIQINKFQNIVSDINYDIIDYTEEIQEKIDGNFASNQLSDSLKNIRLMGFLNCQDAINYYQANNLDPTKRYDNYNKSLYDVCKKTISGEIDTNKIQNYQSLTDKLSIINQNVEDIINKQLIDTSNEKQLIMTDLKPEIPSNLENNIYFKHSITNELIENYYLNKIKSKDLSKPENAIHQKNWDKFIGNYSILDGQYLLLNNWLFTISPDEVTFLFENQPLFKYEYEFISSNINTILIKLNTIIMLNNSTSYTNYDLKTLISLLQTAGIKDNTYIYITLSNSIQKYYKIENLDHQTIIQMKKEIPAPTPNIQFDATLS